MGQSFSSTVGDLELDDSPNHSDGYVVLRIGAIRFVDGFAAKRIEDGLEALLLKCDVTVLRGIEWPKSEGFEVFSRAVDSRKKNETGIYLQLTDERYRELFLKLGDDICDVLIGSTGDKDSIAVLVARLFRWRKFLNLYKTKGLADNQRVGLFGELLVLRDFFMTYHDASEAVSAWRGCKKAEQDFQFPQNAMEVKATRATIPEKVSISNIQQLDNKNMNHLILTVVHLIESPVSGETLPELISSIRGMLPERIHGKFDEGLFEVGYLDSQAELYANSNYQVQSINYHKVKDGFPRLQISELPDGVKGVSYEISLDAARPFQVAEEEARTMMFDKGSD